MKPNWLKAPEWASFYFLDGNDGYWCEFEPDGEEDTGKPVFFGRYQKLTPSDYMEKKP